MRHLVLAACFFPLLAASCSSTGADAPSPEEMMAAWQLAATPSAEHRALDAFVGNWKATVTSWMDPSAPPEVSTGTMVNAWILDGHYLDQRFSGEMMGKPFQGIGTWGYDVAAGKYFGTWRDSMSTTIMVSYGGPSRDGRTFEMSGSLTDPMTGKPSVSDEVIRIDGPDRHTMSMYEKRGGERVKTMEIVYERMR